MADEMIGKMMEEMMNGMTVDEKREILDHMMEKFLGSMTQEDWRALMAEMMPKMMVGMMQGMSPERKDGETPDDILTTMRDCCTRKSYQFDRKESSEKPSDSDEKTK